MAERVGEIEVYAGLEDRDLIAGLRRAEAEVERTAARISRERAEAKVGLDLSEFKRKAKEAEAELRKFEKRQADASLTAGQRRYAKERAAALARELDALKKSQDVEKQRLVTIRSEYAERVRVAKLAEVQAKRDEIRARLLETQEKRRAATAEKRFKQQRDMARLHDKALKENARLDAAAAAAREKALTSEAKAVRDVAAAHERALKEDARLQAASDRAAVQRAKAAERARVASITGASKERLEIAKLQRQYAKLTDQAEKVAKRRAFRTETRAKLALNTEGIYAEMEAVKARLKLLGEEPPIEISVEMERRKSLPRMKRAAAQFGDIFRLVAEKAANLSTIAIRLGPFTGTIKQFAVALAFLGPILVNLLGAAGALVGVLGAGIAGASVVGIAGLTGLGLAFGGIKMSLKSAAADYKLAQSATEAYAKAVAKHGKGSKEAKNAQEQMNRVLKSVSPLARESAMGMQQFRDGWEKATQPTQKSFGSIAKGYFGALNAIRPMWAKSTNDLSKILDTNLKGGFKFFKSREFRGNFEAITGNFNKAVPSLLHGLGSIGRAFLNIAREGSKFLKPFGESFDRMGDRLLKWTQGDTFGATIKRWAKYAADLGRFFGAAARVVMHFFGLGSEAGVGFVVSMTNALNRWDEFLTSTRGRNEIGAAFERAVDGTKALWNAISPLIGVFITWSSTISPFITGLLTGVAAVTSLLTGLSKLLGLGGPLAALGMTLGALWAVSKVGAFVAALARIPAILMAIKAQSGGLAALSAVANGRLLAGMRAPVTAPVLGKGAPGTPGGGMPPVIVPPGAIGNVTKLGKAGGVAKTALMGLGAITTGLASATAGMAVAAGIAGFGLYKYSTRTRDWEKSARGADAASRDMRAGLARLSGSSLELAQSDIALSGAVLGVASANRQAAAEEKQLARLRAQGKTQSREYIELNQQHKQSLLDVQQAELNRSAALQTNQNLARADLMLQEKTLKAARAIAKRRVVSMGDLGNSKTGGMFGVGGRKVEDQYTAISKAATKAGKSVREFLKTREGRIAAIVADADIEKVGQYAKKVDQVAAANRALQVAEDRTALSAFNHQRALSGLVPVAQSAARALGEVSRRAGKSVAKEITVKYKDSGDAARVAQNASKALRAGVSPKVVTKIIADTSNADTAVARLRGRLAGLEAKRAAIRIGASDEASATIGKIVGRVAGIKDKEARIRARDEAIPVIARIISRIAGIPDGRARLIAVDLMSGPARAAAAAINAIPSQKTTTLRTINLGKGVKAKLAAGGIVGAANGFGASQPNERQQERAAQTAALAGSRQTRGGKYSQPTLLVGEENRSEVVISTNPKYRRRNLGFLGMAARALGATVEAAAGGKSPFGSFAGGEFNPKPGAVIKPKRKFKPSKKKKDKLNSNRSWASYIEDLQTQQGYWEREVSIRESQIKEPEDMVIRDPRNDTKIDDGNGGVTTVEAYKANPAIQDSYLPSVKLVMDAMQTLIQIVAELVRAIPEAIKANVQERVARDSSAKSFDDRAKEWSGKAKKTNDKDQKARFEKKADQYRDKRDKEKEIAKTLREDEKTLDASRVTAGFDKRQADIDFLDRKNEYDTVLGKASANAAEQSKPPTASSSGGSSGGTSGGVSIASQTGAAITQSAEVLRAFGNNFISVGGNNAAAQFAAGPLARNTLAGAVSALVGSSSTAGSGGTAFAMRSGAKAASVMARTGTASGTMPGGVSATPGGASETNVTVNNNFLTQPADPHTWSKGIEFELGAYL